MKSFKKASLAAALLLSSSAVMAQNFSLCVPDALFPAVNSGCTADADQMQVNIAATSFYEDIGPTGSISVGDNIVDKGTGNLGGLLLGGLNLAGTDPQGIGTTWRFNLDYDDLTSQVEIIQEVVPIGAPNGEGEIGEIIQVAGAFTGGTIRVTYDDILNDGVNEGAVLFDLLVTGGGISLATVELTGLVDFSAADAIAQNMFFFDDGTNWYDLWLNGGDPMLTIAARFDTNIDPLAIASSSDDAFDFERSSTLNGSVSYNRIPVPGTLAMLGLGLTGLGFARRRRRDS